jgi:hypothetical protein
MSKTSTELLKEEPTVNCNNILKVDLEPNLNEIVKSQKETQKGGISSPPPLQPEYLSQYNKALEAEIIRIKRDFKEAQKFKQLFEQASIQVDKKQEEVNELREDLDDLRKTLKEQALMIAAYREKEKGEGGIS